MNSANPALAKAMADLRRSSAAQPHTPKPKKGTRGKKKSDAIKEQRYAAPDDH